jgi:hypothetical protein
MPRIRTIKPEFPQSESIGRMSREARLCFILLWTIADDSGRTRGSSRMLASLLYPYDDDAPALIDSWLDELEGEHCIQRYKVEGQSYIQIDNWLAHQKIDKPTASKLPPLAKPREESPSAREESSGDLDLDLDLDQGPGPGTNSDPASAEPPAPIPPSSPKKRTPRHYEDPLKQAAYMTICSRDLGADGEPTYEWGPSSEQGLTRFVAHVRARASPEDEMGRAQSLLEVFERLRATSKDRFWREAPFSSQFVGSKGILDRLERQLEIEAKSGGASAEVDQFLRELEEAR